VDYKKLLTRWQEKDTHDGSERKMYFSQPQTLKRTGLIEYRSAVKLADTKDFSEGIRAFLEKREPAWD